VDPTRNRGFFVTNTTIAVTLLGQCSDASYSTCGTCTTNDPNYCGWCATSSSLSCTYNTNCTAQPSKLITTCPTISSVSPKSGATSGGTTVTINGQGFFNDTNLQCKFGSFGTKLAPAQFSFGGQVTCVAPPSTATGNVTVQLVYGIQQLTASNTSTFTYYNCSSLTSCSTCASSANSECGWCTFDAVCASRFSTPVCPSTFSPFVTSQSDASARCAQLLTVNPPSELDVPPIGSTVQITATYFVNITTVRFSDHRS
jgi:hypothetical protein